MVLAQKVGGKRSFGMGLLLTIVTFGVYAVYWNYRAHNEVYRQFELARESRDEGMVWYVLGLVLPPFLLAYLWVMASNVAYVRERIGLRRSMTPGRLVTLVGLGVGAFAIGIIALQAAVLAEGADPSAEQLDAITTTVGLTFLGLAAIAAVFLAVAYRGLQKDINELWDAYDARMGYLQAHAAAPAPLAPRVEALRASHPRLRALPRLAELAARADAGDAAAAQEAQTLLADLDAALDERRAMLQRREARSREAHELRMRVAAGDDPEAAARLEQLASESEDERLAVLHEALYG